MGSFCPILKLKNKMTKIEIIELYLADLNNLVADSDAKRSRIIDLEDELIALKQGQSLPIDNVSESFREEIRLSLEHHQEEEKEQARLNNYSKAMYHNTYVGATQEVLIKMGNYSR